MTIPNDDFDMCCYSRPQVTQGLVGPRFPTIHAYKAKCGICGDEAIGRTLSEVMVKWNTKQREKVKHD